MEVGEALDVQHVHLVHKQHARYQLSYTLVNVAVHHLVDLSTQLVWNGKYGGKISNKKSTCGSCWWLEKAVLHLWFLSFSVSSVVPSWRECPDLPKTNNRQLIKKENNWWPSRYCKMWIIAFTATVLLYTWGLAFATSRSCSVTSWTISFFLCTSPLGSGTYSSASRSNSVAKVSQRPCLCKEK